MFCGSHNDAFQLETLHRARFDSSSVLPLLCAYEGAGIPKAVLWLGYVLEHPGFETRQRTRDFSLIQIAKFS